MGKIEPKIDPDLLAQAQAAGVPKQGLGPALGSAAAHEDDIRRAFERLLTGF